MSVLYVCIFVHYSLFLYFLVPSLTKSLMPFQYIKYFDWACSSSSCQLATNINFKIQMQLTSKFKITSLYKYVCCVSWNVSQRNEMGQIKNVFLNSFHISCFILLKISQNEHQKTLLLFILTLSLIIFFILSFFDYYLNDDKKLFLFKYCRLCGVYESIKNTYLEFIVV